MSVENTPTALPKWAMHLDTKVLMIRLLLASSILAATQLSIWMIDLSFSPIPPSLDGWNLEAIPMQLGEWKGIDRPVNERIFSKSKAALMINRIYSNPLSGRVSAHLAVWNEYPIGLPHTPNDCYTRAGWKIRRLREIEVEESDQQSFPARLITFERQEERVTVLCWYEMGERVVSNRNEVREVMQDARRQHTRLPVIFKSMLQTTDDARAADRLRAFALKVRENIHRVE